MKSDPEKNANPRQNCATVIGSNSANASADSAPRIDVTWSRAARQLLKSQNASLRLINKSARASIAQTLRLSLPVKSPFTSPASSSTRSENRSVEVALSFVDDDEMRELNAQYRGKDKPTDVLSFAQNEGESFPDFSFDQAIQLGDLVVSVETAARQAQERLHSLEQEIEFLCVHGALHLLGYDHANTKQRKMMWSQQDIVMSSIGSPLLVSPSA